MIKPSRLGHLVIRVRDLERSQEFYTQVLGLEVKGRGGDRMVFFRSNPDVDHDLAIMKIGSDAAPPDPDRVGLYHFAYELGSIEELTDAYQVVQEKGVRVAGFGDLKEVDGLWVPEDFGLNRCSARDLAGGGIDQHLELIDDILEGRGRRGLVDTILLNAGAALWAANQTADTGEGVSRARDLLLGGAVKDWLRKACEFYSS